MVTRREATLALLSGAVLEAACGIASAQEPQALQLPQPQQDGGKLLIDALRMRRSTREYSKRALSVELLSKLLWAAFGINRPESHDRTAPSWRHSMEIKIYVATAEAVWCYEPRPHQLLLHMRGDIRNKTGTQDFVASAPINLVYVADANRMFNASPEEKRLFAFTDTGFIGQNIYLFCAAEGLGSVFRGSVDREALAQTMRLDPSQFITFAQTVGYPIA